jgi:WD40 repeat protein
MPAHDCLGPDNRNGIEDERKAPIKPNEQSAIGPTQTQSTSRTPSKHVQLDAAAPAPRWPLRPRRQRPRRRVDRRSREPHSAPRGVGVARIWDLASGTQRGEALFSNEGEVVSAALGALYGRPVIVSGFNDRTVQVWDLALDTPCGEPLRGHSGPVMSIALGTLNNRPLIVSGGEDGIVRLWHPAGETPLPTSGL